jgi:hypothetical protein
MKRTGTKQERGSAFMRTALSVGLVAGVVAAAVALNTGIALAHHATINVTYTCSTYNVDADYIGGSQNKLVRVFIDADGDGPGGYGPYVAEFPFYGVASSPNFWTENGNLPVNRRFKTEMYADANKDGPSPARPPAPHPGRA